MRSNYSFDWSLALMSLVLVASLLFVVTQAH
jgi:hypothetical protein